MSKDKRRLIATLEKGDHKAKVYHSPVWAEYVVEFHYQGAHQDKADYHTEDKQDAHDTAKAGLARLVAYDLKRTAPGAAK